MISQFFLIVVVLKATFNILPKILHLVFLNLILFLIKHHQFINNPNQKDKTT